MTSATSVERDAKCRDPHGGVTLRALAIGFVLLALVAVLNFYVELAWGVNWSVNWQFSSGVPAVVPVVVLFLLTLLMTMPILARVGLRRRELLVIYSLVLVGAPVVTPGIVAWILVKPIAYHYAAAAQLHWETIFLKQLPGWWAPGSPAAVEGFFHGGMSVPWSVWAVPLAAWTGFSISLFVCTLCVMALVQRQWITNERLTFPLAQMPLEMVRNSREGQAHSVGRLPITGVFWIGFFISLMVNFLSSLSLKIPAMPDISLFLNDLIPWQGVGPLAGLGGVTLVFWPWMIAIAYLIPKELSFSIWFFCIIRFLLTVAAIAAGASPMRPEDWWSTSFPAPYYQGTGALLVLCVWTVWIARRHLIRAARAALSGQSGSEDAREPLAYRWAFLGLLASFACIVYFLWLADCRVGFGIAVASLTIGYFAIWGRLRAETGLGFLSFPHQIPELAMVPFGSRVFRISEVVALVTLRSFYTPGFSYSFEVFPGAALESFKVADSAHINARRLTLALTAGFLFSLVAGILIFMTGVYHYGWFGLSLGLAGWVNSQALGDGGRIVSLLTEAGTSETDVNGLMAVLAGGVVVVILGLMRLRFWWWPFHPVGYLASNTWGFQWWWSPFLVGWAAKALVIRYGGLRLYRSTLPFAVGLIVGELMNGGIWATVRVVTQGRL
jgi:hypothetical protein